MTFVLRIFISGLIAFVPGADDQGLTLLLLDVPDGYTSRSGLPILEHTPMLLARAATCSGPCAEEVPALVAAMNDPAAGDSPWTSDRLGEAIGGGAAWLLDGEDLGILGDFAARDGGSTEDQVNSFEALVNLDALSPASVSVNPALLAPSIDDDQISARLRLPAGAIRVYDFVRIGSDKVALDFRESGGGTVSGWQPRPLANWMAIDVPISGCEIEVMARRFSDQTERRITLGPENCQGNEVVELVLLNVPKEDFHPPKVGQQEPAHSGNHFETYFEISSLRDARERYVPFVSVRGDLPEQSRSPAPGSFIREALRPKVARGSYAQVICPLALLPAPTPTASR